MVRELGILRGSAGAGTGRGFDVGTGCGGRMRSIGDPGTGNWACAAGAAAQQQANAANRTTWKTPRVVPRLSEHARLVNVALACRAIIVAIHVSVTSFIV
jgi:hypothetical protein